MRGARIIVAICLLALAAGCSTSKHPSGEDYYAQGQKAFAKGNYHETIDDFQNLVDKYPFSPYTEDAELKIGLAHYKNGDYAEATTALVDFERMHPTSKNIELASYYLAMAYYDQIGREDQDQGNTERALEGFQLVEHRFPESPFAELARERIAVCREMLARHQMIIANFYYRQANLRAAESRLVELLEKWPDTPVAPDALWELSETLEKEGKKYSAAQAFTALKLHFKDTVYAKRVEQELKTLKQPVDSEEDPLKLVLAEAGFSGSSDGETDHQAAQGIGAASFQTASARSAPESAYGADGLPILDRPAAKDGHSDHQRLGPATLRTVRLASSDPPLPVILDLSGPVKFDDRLENGDGFSTLTVRLDQTEPDPGMQRHLVFDRSIFKDTEVTSDGKGTTVTVNTAPVTRFAVVPLEEPPRLLITFSPKSLESDESAEGAGAF